jgi:tRNA1Val (adenine37-N6)-methyltransferase
MKPQSETETIDTILGGALTIVQPLQGYRFSVDAILLGRFARPRMRDRVLELGAGCGVVSVMIAALNHPRAVLALELQPALAAMAARNAERNGLAEMAAICADLRARAIAGAAPASFDYIVANPPYRAPRTGRESPHPARRIARGGGGATLTEFLAAARRYGAHGARVAMVFTAARSAELIAELKARALEPKRIRFVHPGASAPAALILIEARAGGGVEVEIEPPLILYDAPGVYSAEARELLGIGGDRDDSDRGGVGAAVGSRGQD